MKTCILVVRGNEVCFWKFPRFKYSLFYTHRLLCPDDSDLASRAHCEDADEETLYKQVGIYFKGTRTEVKPSRIQAYLSPRAPGNIKKLKNQGFRSEKSEPLASLDFKKIKDIEDVIADASSNIKFSVSTELIGGLARRIGSIISGRRDLFLFRKKAQGVCNGFRIRR